MKQALNSLILKQDKQIKYAMMVNDHAEISLANRNYSRVPYCRVRVGRGLIEFTGREKDRPLFAALVPEQ